MYFARPYAFWQRGSNENFNGLLRQYFPKRYFLLVSAQPALPESSASSTSGHGSVSAGQLHQEYLVQQQNVLVLHSCNDQRRRGGLAAALRVDGLRPRRRPCGGGLEPRWVATGLRAQWHGVDTPLLALGTETARWALRALPGEERTPWIERQNPRAPGLACGQGHVGLAAAMPAIVGGEPAQRVRQGESEAAARFLPTPWRRGRLQKTGR